MCKNQLCEEYDLCIVGAGMFGSAAARHASVNPALKVCLIGPEEPRIEEYKNHEIFGSHYDEGRIINSSESCEEFQTLNRESISRFHELEKLSGIKFYNPSGSMLLLERYHSENAVVLSSNKPGNTQWVELTSKDLFKNRFPFLKLKEDFRAYLDDKGAGHISPRKMIAAQMKVAHLQGCHIIHDVVKEVRDPINGMHEIITDSNIIVKSKRVLLCPGAFVNFRKLLSGKQLKVFIRRETSVLMRIPVEESVRLSAMPALITRNKGPDNQPDLIGAYVLPPINYPDGHYYLKIGHIGEIVNSEMKTLKEINQWYQSSGSDDVIKFYSSMLKDLLPELKVEEIRGKSCVTVDSPTGFPYVDRISPTVTIAAIGNSRGAGVCEEVGRIAAHLSITGKWDSKLSKSLFEAIYEDN